MVGIVDSASHINSDWEACDARGFANFVLDECNKNNRQITHLALQKLVYFCHAWFLAKYEIPLVEDPVEAWKRGPVFKSIYEAFKSAGNSPITSRAKRINFATGQSEVVDFVTSADKAIFLRQVLGYYVNFSAGQLVRISHQKSGPWQHIWEASKSDPNIGMRIPNDLILKHFQRDQLSMLPN